MGTFYLVTLYLQQVLQFSPVVAGAATLPFSVGIILGSIVSSKLVESLAPRTVAAPGLLIAAIGMGWLSTLFVGSSYWTHLVPALFLTSFGLGMAAVTFTLTAAHGVSDDRAGIASALLNSAQQFGAALGLAAATSIATTAANNMLPDPAKALIESVASGDRLVTAQAGAALTHGYTTAFLAGAAMLAAAAVVAFTAVTTRKTQSASVSANDA